MSPAATSTLTASALDLFTRSSFDSVGSSTPRRTVHEAVRWWLVALLPRRRAANAGRSSEEEDGAPPRGEAADRKCPRAAGRGRTDRRRHGRHVGQPVSHQDPRRGRAGHREAPERGATSHLRPGYSGVPTRTGAAGGAPWGTLGRRDERGEGRGRERGLQDLGGPIRR